MMHSTPCWARIVSLPVAVAPMLFGCVERRVPEPIAILDSAPPPAAACDRPEALESPPEEEVVLDEVSGFPCRLVVVRTGVTLDPSRQASRPDPNWTFVARDGQGRIYTPATLATGAGEIMVWDSLGTFRKVIGGKGEGPGELHGRGLPGLFVGPADSLYVREAGRWSVFGPDGVFARLMLNPAVDGRPGRTHVLDDGRFLSTGPVVGGSRTSLFHLASADGDLIRSFGTLERSASSGGGLPPDRPSAYGGGETFWVAPPRGAPGGYVIEEWSVDGELRRSIRRPVPWLRPVDEDHEQLRALPAFSLHIDDEGLLLVAMITADPRWRPVANREERDDLMTELYDIRYEVIDPDAGRVLVSGLLDVVPGEDERNSPPISNPLPGTTLTSRPLPLEMGFEAVEFFHMALVDVDAEMPDS